MLPCGTAVTGLGLKSSANRKSFGHPGRSGVWPWLPTGLPLARLGRSE